MNVYLVKSKMHNAMIGAEAIGEAIPRYYDWLEDDWAEYAATDDARAEGFNKPEEKPDFREDEDYEPTSVELLGDVVNWPEESEPAKLRVVG